VNERTDYGGVSPLLSPVPAALDEPAHRFEDRAQPAFRNQQFPAVLLQGQRPGPPCGDLIGGGLAAAVRAESEPAMGNSAMSQRYLGHVMVAVREAFAGVPGHFGEPSERPGQVVARERKDEGVGMASRSGPHPYFPRLM
jgi:hypothetical protein